MINSYLETFQKPTSTIPVITDEETALTVIRKFSGLHITELGECISGNIPNISLYEKSPETKHWGIIEARRFIDDISEKPYIGKAMYIIQDFDEATKQAMNALLKILEEPPEYAIIILIANNPEAIIETIHSRTLSFFKGTEIEEIPENWKKASKLYFTQNDIGPLLGLLSSEKLSNYESISLLLYSAVFANQEMCKRIEKGIMDLYGVNESSKNVLDRVFL